MRIAESASHQIFERKWRRLYRHVCFSVEGITNQNAIDCESLVVRKDSQDRAVLSLNTSVLCENSQITNANEVVSSNEISGAAYSVNKTLEAQ
jgi:hypothetical protein